MPLIVLTNEDGPEAAFAKESAGQAAEALGAPILRLKEGAYREQTDRLRRDTLCFMATHGGQGENGVLQGMLEGRGIRHTHSGAWACANMSDKHLTKLLYSSLGIRTPAWRFRGTDHGRIGKKLVAKPHHGGGKRGLALPASPRNEKGMLYENLVPGTIEASVCVIGHATILVLGPGVRVRDVKRIGHLEDSDMRLPRRTEKACMEAAAEIHKALGAYGVTKTDFAIDPEGKAWALETDAHPGLGKTRAAAVQAARAGIPYGKFIRLILKEYAGQ